MSTDPVLLLHGQPGAAADWEAVRAALGDALPTIAVERPGWARRSVATDLAGNARAALAALDAAAVARATVVGHSLGAAVALWLSCASPHRVGRIVLVAPAANVASLGPVDYLLAAPAVGWLASAGAMAAGGLMLGVGPVRRWLAAATALDERYLRAAGRMLLAPAAWRSFVREQRFLVRDLPALERRLGEISIPTTIVAGSADHVVPTSAARHLAGQIPGAELVVLEGAGHLLHVQHAARLAEVIAGT
ncbi:MAG: alpha/beta hydrolase [Solirubrobacterales bacterium]|nr:alpha/beta hydrolase [Solirubrobacterales bacterium]